MGTVEDVHGAPIAGVVVMAAKDHETTGQTATVDEKGKFTISGLEPGTYAVSIALPGRSPQVATEVTLGTREERELPIVTSRNPHSSTTVRVNANLEQVATAQVHLQEKQRVLGVVPNFYTSYIWNSAPLTPKLKFKLALRAEIDPIEFAVDAGVAGAEQYHNTFPGYGGGWQGYGNDLERRMRIPRLARCWGGRCFRSGFTRTRAIFTEAREVQGRECGTRCRRRL